MDDGARSLEQSIAMIRLAAACGTTDLVATPHSSPKYPFDPHRVAGLIAELASATGPTPRIHRGCDFHLAYDSIQDALVHPTKYTINHGRYLLVEFSNLAVFSTSTDVLGRLIEAGMVPVITHPERNSLLQRRLDDLERWVALGCLIQITAQSLLGHFGSRARDFCDTLFARGLVHFVASDAHDDQRRPPRLDEARRRLAKKYGEAEAERLTVANPRAAIQDMPLPERAVSAVAARSWRWFWQ